MAGRTPEYEQTIHPTNQHQDLNHVNVIQSNSVRDGSGGNHRLDTYILDCGDVLPGHGAGNPDHGLLRNAGAFRLCPDDAGGLANTDHFFDDILDGRHAGDQTGYLPGR